MQYEIKFTRQWLWLYWSWLVQAAQRFTAFLYLCISLVKQLFNYDILLFSFATSKILHLYLYVTHSSKPGEASTWWIIPQGRDLGLLLQLMMLIVIAISHLIRQLLVHFLAFLSGVVLNLWSIVWLYVFNFLMYLFFSIFPIDIIFHNQLSHLVHTYQSWALYKLPDCLWYAVSQNICAHHNMNIYCSRMVGYS